jgi:flagellar biosynthesis/type III secretory pathway protein FliH
MPFTFDDLGAHGHERPEAGFVSFFGAGTAEAEKDETPGPPDAPAPSLEDLARKAFEDAYAEGERAGRDMGARRVEAIAKRLEKYIEELTSFRVTLAGKYEKFAVELALKASGAIILRECEEHRDILAAMIKKAMEMCEEHSELVIRVRAEDVRYVEAIRSDRIKVIADDRLKEPGFTIETRVGDIDGKIGSQIEELRRALTGDHE